MLEIGKPVTRPVRIRIDGKLRPKLGIDGQPETVSRPRNTWRVTKDTLGDLGRDFGVDGKRKLAVGLLAGDILALRPYGTRQEVQVSLANVYRYALRRKAALELLHTASEAKQRKAVLRECHKLRRQEAKFRQSLRA